jgi:tetratricopeptide (TPR) repeat protein
MMKALRRRLARPFRNRARLAQTQGRWADALSSLRKAEALDTGNPAILLQIGNSHTELGEYDAAEAAFSSASKTPRFIVRAAVGLAGVAERRLDWGTAAHRWETVLLAMAQKEDAPGDDRPVSPAYALMHSALCRERIGDGSGADRDLGLAIALDARVRHLPEAILMRARIIGGADPHAARQLLQAAVRRYPMDRTIRFEAMVATLRSGDRVTTARLADALLELAPGDPGVIAFAREHNLVLSAEVVG